MSKMSEISPANEIGADDASLVGGGDCTIRDLQDALNQIKESYETLVDFTAHVIDRVMGGTGNP